MCAMWLFGAHGLRIMGKYMGKLDMHVSLKKCQINSKQKLHLLGNVFTPIYDVKLLCMVFLPT